MHRGIDLDVVVIASLTTREQREHCTSMSKCLHVFKIRWSTIESHKERRRKYSYYPLQSVPYPNGRTKKTKSHRKKQ